MLVKLIQATGLKRFLAFVTPAFFDVVPAGKMLGQARRLIADYRNEDEFETAVRIREKALDEAGLGVSLTSAPLGAPLEDLPEADRKAAGEAVLRLFFHQLFTDEPTLLDLSAQRFGSAGASADEQGGVCWRAGPGHVRWDPRFQASVRKLYIGFYGDDDAVMADGLRALNLESASDLFREHFGLGDQTRVLFSVDHFVSTFHKVFVHCKDHGIQLDAGFLPLGIYLASMYETLDRLDVALDVRSAFRAATRSAQSA